MGVSLYLTVDGVTGASLEQHHEGAVECSTWSWGLTSDGNHFGGGRGSGKARLDELVLTMPTTGALPQLLALCATGRVARQAVLTATSGGPEPHTWLRVTLTDVAVTRVATAASTPEQRSDDEVHLGFRTVTLEHIAQAPDGSALPATVFAWDARRQRAIGDATSELKAGEDHDPGHDGKKGHKGKRNHPKVKAKGMARLLD